MSQAVKAPKLARNYSRYAVPASANPHSATEVPWRIHDLCKAYNLPLLTQPGGAVIGILELGGGYTTADLQQFAKNNKLPMLTTISDINIGGSTNSPGSDADGEVLLDIQVIWNVYHYCTGKNPVIKMIWVPNSDQAFVQGIQAAVAAGCNVLSISWGADEKSWGKAAAQSVEAAALQASAAGLTIFAAAGDNSSGDSDPGANVDVPSACPHVVGCGGTTKTASSEVVWGDGTPSGEGTGGGFSNFFPTQSWQVGAPVHAGRMVPDVAANADPNTGYLVVINGQEQPVGGTSAVAPFYAALFASSGQKLGFVTPKLWANPSDFNDITQGSNGAYKASVGADPCTGLGSPKGSALAKLL